MVPYVPPPGPPGPPPGVSKGVGNGSDCPPVPPVGYVVLGLPGGGGTYVGGGGGYLVPGVGGPVVPGGGYPFIHSLVFGTPETLFVPQCSPATTDLRREFTDPLHDPDGPNGPNTETFLVLR